MHGAENKMIESAQETVLRASDTTQNKDTGDFMAVEIGRAKQHVRHKRAHSAGPDQECRGVWCPRQPSRE